MLFLYNCDIRKTVKHVKILPKNFINIVTGNIGKLAFIKFNKKKF